MQLVHGNTTDGYIHVSRKQDGEFKDFCFIPMESLPQCGKVINDHYKTDAYHSVNLFYQTAQWINKKIGLPGATKKDRCVFGARCKENLRWLTACFADLDCGRSEEESIAKGNPALALPPEVVKKEVLVMMESGLLPMASIIAESGRGIYLFWFLRDDEGMLVRGDKYNYRIVEGLNKAIYKLLLHLGADERTSDATRICRIPGSIHSGASREVKYYLHVDEHGDGFTYTPAGLREMLGCSDPTPQPPAPAVTGQTLTDEESRLVSAELPEEPKRTRRTKSPGSNPNRKNGFKALCRMRVADLLAIEKYRGGWRKRGTLYPDDPDRFRSNGRLLSLDLFAQSMRGAEYSREETKSNLLEMAGRCIPSYPSDENDTPINCIVDQVFSMPHIKAWNATTLCQVLGVTEEIASKCHLATIVPVKRQKKGGGKVFHGNERKGHITEIIRDHHGHRLSLRTMSGLLAQKGDVNPDTGKPWTRKTILYDYKDLGYASDSRLAS
jgi:hypothetical protein